MSGKTKKPVEVIVFQDPSKRSKWQTNKSDTRKKPPSAKDDPIEPSTSSDKRPIFDQKKAKYDIRKLGIHGMDKTKKEGAMVDLLVELGAKPPRNKCYHPQEYRKMMKKKEEEEKLADEMERSAGIKKKKDKRKRNKDDILNYVDGQSGFYKDGVQFVKRLKK